MAPRTAASVCWCALFCFVLCFNSVFGDCTRSYFTSEELSNIRVTTPDDLFPTFLLPTLEILDILVKGAHSFAHPVKRRRRGRRASALVRLSQRGLRTPLPGIFLSNVRSLPNKLEELQLLLGNNRDFLSSAVLCFTETWLSGLIPDSALHLAGFQLCRADRDTELSGKTKGGGICFYINSGWCNNVTVIQQHCSPDLESFIINCKPFYSPREFASFILVGVYIPPQANVQDAQHMLADQILCVERTNPDYLVIVLGDFNKGNLTHDLPKYRQVIKCPTRGENILDHCYTTVRDAYHAVPRAALGHSDHVMVHLIPAYRQKLKLCKPVVRTSRKWTSGGSPGVTATNSLDEYTEAVTSYISFCEDCCVPSRTRVSYNNNKPWFTAKLRRLRLDKEEAFRSGDKDRFKEAKYKFSKAVKEAKRLYSEKLQHQFSANDSASVWKGLRQITNYKPKAPYSINDQRLANDLNEFYCRFERQRDSPATIPHDSSQQLQLQGLGTSTNAHLKGPPPTPPPTSVMTLSIHERDVNKLFRRQNPREAAGPDSVSPSTLKHCADQLSPAFTDIFNTSLETCHVSACFKTSTIIPVPKKPRTTGLNDFRPVALTSVVMKSFERLVLSHLKDITDPFLDPLQFAYRANRSVDYAVNLAPNLEAACEAGKTCLRLPGCVLSPLLFSLYTNSCTSSHQSVKLLKFADDTTLIGHISDGDESAYRWEADHLVTWCHRNNLELNALKTVEMVVDFRKNSASPAPITLCDSTIDTVESFHFLGTIISQDLKWELNISSLIKKAQQRMYFLRQLKKFNLPRTMMVHFYSSIIESILTSSITIWYAAATAKDKGRLQRVIRSAEKVTGCNLPSLQDLYTSRTLRRA
ncbi:putative RNA-directed DNA polymerase from transposon BS [Merluccius polli]|uniref:RNA-directed DNA polymerase from transposon BS n=1 Tax=Merluccius polli TaxID=89951 RepID=A0AA47NLR4_MERPO|nr:putative RNA-directed DNA polymerase from transposon BS [Merluccius polli]